MNMSRRRFAGAAAAVTAGSLLPRTIASTTQVPVPATARAAEPPALLKRALAASNTNARVVPHRDVIGLADFSAASREARFHIVDVANGRIIGSHLVSHGKGSDPANSGFVQQFSNLPGSNASSEGSFLVADTYFGKHGRSRRLIGLDPANSLALERAIVIHAADYVSADMARNQGRIGRSQGCFAFSDEVLDPVLARLGPGHLLFAGK